MAKDDGGPAFPSGDNVAIEFDAGMSLRDWFAGQALSGIVTGLNAEEFKNIAEGITAGRPLALASYALADAMLAERSK